jgi:hypothetical protein
MSTPSHYEKAETKFSLLPYASNVGSPVIVVEDTDPVSYTHLRADETLS